MAMFPREEIIKAYKSFNGVSVTKEFLDPVNSIGQVIVAEWNEKENAVDGLVCINRQLDHSLCKLVEKRLVTVAMACQINFHTCLACNYPIDINRKHTNYVSKAQCAYDIAPGTINYGLEFIQLSIVQDGACEGTGIIKILGNKKRADEYIKNPKLLLDRCYKIS